MKDNLFQIVLCFLLTVFYASLGASAEEVRNSGVLWIDASTKEFIKGYSFAKGGMLSPEDLATDRFWKRVCS